MGRVGFDPRSFFPGMAGHPCLILRATSLSLQGDPANIGKGRSRPARMPQEQTENGGIVLAAYAGPRAPRGGVTQKRRCTHRHSQSSIDCQYTSLSLSLSLSNLDDVLQGWGQVCNIIRQSRPNGSVFENLKGLHPSSLLLRYCSLSPAP